MFEPPTPPHGGGLKNLAQNGKNQNGEKVGQIGFQTHWNRKPQEDDLKQSSNLKSMEAEITKKTTLQKDRKNALLEDGISLPS